MKKLLLAALASLWAGVAVAQCPTPIVQTGPLLIQQQLTEIGCLGPTAQANARAALGITGPVSVPTTPLLGGAAGAFTQIGVGTGLSLSGSSLGVLYGTASGTALQGSLRGAASGVASLDGSSLVPLVQIPIIPATQTSGFGSIATQSAGSVAITGGAINGTALGGVTPAAGAFSTLSSNTNLIVPNLASTLTTAGSIAFNTGTGRYDFGIGGSVVNHVRLSGDTMTGSLNIILPGTDATSLFVGDTAGAATVGLNRENTGFGQGACNATTDTANACFGWHAGFGALTHALTALGSNAGSTLASPTDMIAIGTAAMTNLDDGTLTTFPAAQDLALGVHALAHLSTGKFEVAIGNLSMSGCGNWLGCPTNLLTGDSNTGVGYQTLTNIFGAAFENTAVGSKACNTLTTGFEVVCIGSLAGTGLTTGSLGIYIGRDILATAPDAVGDLNIGNLITGSGVTQGGSAANGTVAIHGGLSATGSIISGQSGSTGKLTIFPHNAATGSLDITEASNTGDTKTTINVAGQAVARIFTVPDPGFNAAFILDTGAAVRADPFRCVNADSSVLNTTGSATTFKSFMSYGSTVALVGANAQGATITSDVVCNFIMPLYYTTGSNFTLTVNALYAGAGTVGTATITASAERVTTAGAFQTDIGPGTTLNLTTAAADYAFLITGTTVGPGDEISFKIRTVIQETGGSLSLHTALASLRVR